MSSMSTLRLSAVLGCAVLGCAVVLQTLAIAPAEAFVTLVHAHCASIAESVCLTDSGEQGSRRISTVLANDVNALNQHWQQWASNEGLNAWPGAENDSYAVLPISFLNVSAADPFQWLLMSESEVFSSGLRLSELTVGNHSVQLSELLSFGQNRTLNAGQIPFQYGSFALALSF